uniref:Nucleotide exchange factor Fes1 domain-containing protein n=1 Tax=Aureoumbra lagunensis TaxID=44058 RepID=A0A7S3K680_9STRA|mmetsp:Transcript_13785/g.18405  ORF Transcript_13785/g.18405 Transcript_13785/m.18405 type:complete len:442 (+) Transcript_13785:89-1414(+)
MRINNLLLLGLCVVGGKVAVLDMESGEKWIDANESLNQRFRESVNAATAHEDVQETYDEGLTREEIRRKKIVSALNKLPDSEIERLLMNSTNSIASLDLQTLDAIWNRRQEELRAAIEASSASAQIITPFANAVRKFETEEASSSDIENIQQQIKFLDDEIYDIDVARDFFDAFQGIKLLIPLLDNVDLASSALQLLGTAVSNDAALQDAVLPLIPQIIHLLRTNDTLLQKKAIFAIGSAIRQNIKSLTAFAQNDGLAAVSSALTQAAATIASTTNNDDKSNFAIVDKAATLLGDILSEKSTSPIIITHSSPNALTEVCNALITGINIVPSDRRVERLLRATYELTHKCISIWLPQQQTILARLDLLATTIKTPDPDYQQELIKLTTDLAALIGEGNKISSSTDSTSSAFKSSYTELSSPSGSSGDGDVLMLASSSVDSPS